MYRMHGLQLVVVGLINISKERRARDEKCGIVEGRQYRINTHSQSLPINL